MTTRPIHLARRGMTFLEVVAATALLALVGAVLFSTLSFATRWQSRDQMQLGAAEVANRLVLAYLDDPTHMPDSHKTLAYGPLQYRWDYVEQPVLLTEVAPDRRDTSRQSPLSPDRFTQVTVRAWLSEQSGGSRYPDGTVPMARLTRMLDPVTPRNPDSFMNTLQNPDGFRRMMEGIMGFQGTTVRGGTPGNSPGQQNANQNQTRQRPGAGQFGARQAFSGGGRRASGSFGGLFGGRGFTRGGTRGGGTGAGSGAGPGQRVLLGGGR